jgi:carnitine monooxygenase subunit
MAEVSSAQGRAGEESGLPPWTYTDPDFFALECARILRPAWQIVCHQSDIAERGQYATLAFLGAVIFVIRGEDGVIRAFRNVCRHRAARLLDEPFGQCRSRIVCPYHAWTYDLQGRLIGIPERGDYEPVDPEKLGLTPVELGICGGFVFVRPAPGGPDFAEFSAPFREEFALYRTEDMRALGRVTLRERAVNWKVATDNYVDVLHLPVAHRGLWDLVGDSYRLEAEAGTCRISSRLQKETARTWSNRAYCNILPETDHLPPSHRDSWRYLKLWPNLAFDLYPDQMDFMQFIPLSPARTLLREIPYALPDERREMRAARYLNWRINRVVNREDQDLIERVQAGLQSPDYVPGPLPRSEAGLRDFAARMRRELPVCRT